MITWDFYSKRRNIDLVSFIKRRDVENYEQLVSILEEQQIEPPGSAMFQAAYAIAFPPIPVPRKPKPVPRKRPRKTAAAATTPDKKPATRKRKK